MSDFGRLGGAVKEAMGAPPPGTPELRARIIEAASRRPRPGWRVLTLGLGAAAVIGAAVGVWRTREPAVALACEREGRPVAVSAWLSEGPAPLRFADGTTIALRDGARARISRNAQRRVHLSLERGELDAEVVPGKGMQWSFHAGPYEVRVLGTGLKVRWDGTNLGVHVRHGRVAVARTDRDEETVVSTGGRLEAGPTGMSISHEQQAPRIVPLASPTVVEPEIAEPEVRPRAVEPRRTSVTPERWKVAARANRFEEAVVEAERLGIGGLLRGAPADDLLLLSDAARLARRPELAGRALQATRERFGRRAGAVAAFRLGRLAYDDGRYVEAATWFETFAQEAPADALAEKARGRAIEAWRLSGRADKARNAARAYLQHHPHDSYAGLARQTLDSDGR